MTRAVEMGLNGVFGAAVHLVIPSPLLRSETLVLLRRVAPFLLMLPAFFCFVLRCFRFLLGIETGLGVVEPLLLKEPEP